MNECKPLSVGGCRASIYNAMPMEGVKALTDFMTAFKAGAYTRSHLSSTKLFRAPYNPT